MRPPSSAPGDRLWDSTPGGRAHRGQPATPPSGGHPPAQADGAWWGGGEGGPGPKEWAGKGEYLGSVPRTSKLKPLGLYVPVMNQMATQSRQIHLFYPRL